MAPTPYAPDGRLDIFIPVPGAAPHRVQLPVDIVAFSSPTTLSHTVTPVLSIDTATAAQQFWDLVKPMYNTAVTGANWVLYQRDVNIFVPIDAGALTGAGTSSNPTAVGMAYTFTFKDVDQYLQRIQIPETADILQRKYSQATIPSPYSTFVTDVLATSSTGVHIGDWLRTRSGIRPARFLFATNTGNRKLRRTRGLA